MGDVFVRIITVGLIIIGKNYATPYQIVKKDTNSRAHLKYPERRIYDDYTV